MIAALDDFRPSGHALELACGPGTWTAQLLRHADSLAAVDAAPEMLRIAADKGRDERGRVAFVADAYRTPEELIEGEGSAVIRRHLKDGTSFRAVKVAHAPEELEERLRHLGWNLRVRYLRAPFFWGTGGRTG